MVTTWNLGDVTPVSTLPTPVTVAVTGHMGNDGALVSVVMAGPTAPPVISGITVTGTGSEIKLASGTVIPDIGAPGGPTTGRTVVHTPNCPPRTISLFHSGPPVGKWPAFTTIVPVVTSIGPATSTTRFFTGVATDSPV